MLSFCGKSHWITAADREQYMLLSSPLIDLLHFIVTVLFISFPQEVWKLPILLINDVIKKWIRHEPFKYLQKVSEVHDYIPRVYFFIYFFWGGVLRFSNRTHLEYEILFLLFYSLNTYTRYMTWTAGPHVTVLIYSDKRLM